MSEKYVGVDAHQAGLVIEVMGAKGNCLMHSVIPTRADAIKEYFSGLKGTVHVTFEEGTLAEWLYSLIQPLVAKVIVCVFQSKFTSHSGRSLPPIPEQRYQ